MTTAEQGRALHRARQDLISLKWRLSDALENGIPLDAICKTLGKPWTPALLVQAFPDIARKHELTAIPPTPLAEPLPWTPTKGGIDKLACKWCGAESHVAVTRPEDIWRCPECERWNEARS